MNRNLKRRLASGQVFTGPNGETLRRDVRDGEAKVVMESPRTGRHSLDFGASSSGRIAAHWRGFTSGRVGEAKVKRRKRWTPELAELRRRQRAFINDLFDCGKPATRTEYTICLALIRAVDSIRTAIEEQTGESEEHDRSCR